MSQFWWIEYNSAWLAYKAKEQDARFIYRIWSDRCILHGELKNYDSVISDFHSCGELRFKCLFGVQSESRKVHAWCDWYRFSFLNFAGLKQKKKIDWSNAHEKSYDWGNAHGKLYDWGNCTVKLSISCKQNKRKKICETSAPVYLLGTGQKLEGGRAGASLFWPTSFGETLPIPGAEKMLTPQNSLHNLSWSPPPPHPSSSSRTKATCCVWSNHYKV